MRNTKYLLSLFAAVVLTATGYGFAHALPYSPGQTLDPNCNPGDANCTVSATSTILQNLNIQAAAGADNLFDVASSSGASYLHVNGSGFIGINTTTPATALSIAGTLTLQQTMGNMVISNGNGSICTPVTHTIIIGGGSTNGNCVPDFSVIIGDAAQTFGNGNNYYQVVIGYGAQTTSGEPKNVVIGAQTTSNGPDQVIIGYLANAGSSGTVAIGSHASATSSASIAIGISAGAKGANSANFGGKNLNVINDNTFSYGVAATLHGFGTLTPQNRVDISGAAAIGSYAGSKTAPTNGLIVSGAVGFGTSTPAANFQIANGTNATTTVEFGSSGQNKGTCLKLYRSDGSAIYASVAAGTTAFTLSTTSCANVTGF